MSNMQIPYRKPGKYSQLVPDPLMTDERRRELQNKLTGLKKAQPSAAEEVARLAQLGDFSENAEYQLAKGHLRGINNGILRLENQLHQAVIIRPQAQKDTVQVGHVVTVASRGVEKTYQILGSTETNPKKGIISQHSPLGAALIGKKIGETVSVKLPDKEVAYEILKIE